MTTPQDDCEERDLFGMPQKSWTEGAKLKAQNGNTLRRWGSVRQACKILDDCDRKVLYDLIEIKAVAAYKLRPHASNSKWRVDLMSVWQHKQRQIAQMDLY